MNMAVEIQVPPILKGWGFDKDKIQRYATLFTEEHISSGKAATLLDITRFEFLSLLKKRGLLILISVTVN